MPNTPDNWQTVARTHDPERLALWQYVFGGHTAPIKSILTHRVDLPGHPNAQVYEMDLAALTPEQRTRLVESIAGKFNLPSGEIEALLDTHGCPILASDVVASTIDHAHVANLLY